jgi:hypothetical protein
VKIPLLPAAAAAVAVLLVPARAPAQGGSLEYPGWTSDGSYFSYSNTSGSVPELSVLDATTGIAVADAYQCSFDPDASPVCGRLAATLQDTIPSRTSPDGKGKAEVVLVMKKGGGRWEGGRFVREARFESELRVVRDGISRVSAVVTTSVTDVTPYWSPDGKRVAWLIDEGSRQCGLADCTQLSAVIGSAGGVNVQILADNAILSRVVRPVAKAVAAAGLTPAFVGKALKAREKSAVYFGEGFKAQADQIAAALPGGASVEKLTWKSPADVVVAVGASAVPARAAGKAKR